MKYMGSKERIATPIVSVIHDCIEFIDTDVYIEPFVGGANILDKVRCKNRVGSDINYYLIALLSHVRDGGELPEFVDRDTYMNLRASLDKEIYLKGKYLPTEYEDWYIGACGFLASYNGRFFNGGYGGYVETKDGSYRNYYDEAKRNLIKQSELFKGAEFICRDFREVEAHNSVIYCDIPYFGTSNYIRSEVFDHNSFWEWAREKSKDNIVLISEYTAPIDFECVWSGKITTTIDNRQVLEATEKLFIHKDWYEKMGYGEEDFDF